MSRPVPAEGRPWTVAAAEITMVLHGLVLGAAAIVLLRTRSVAAHLRAP